MISWGDREYLEYDIDHYLLIKIIILIIAGVTEFILLILFSVSYQYPFFNVNAIDLSEFDGLLKIIIPSLTTILAILFALSQFILTNIIDKYSTQFLERHENNSTGFLLFLYVFTILFSFMLSVLAMSEFCPQFYVFGLILSVYLFIISFSVLVDYLHYMFTLINPSKLADILKDEIITAIKKQNETDVRDDIIAMGDITTKLIKNHEEKVSIQYIDYLKDISSDFLVLMQEDPDRFNIQDDMFHSQEDNNVLNYILIQYLRIYKLSVDNNSSSVSNRTAKNLFEILNGVLHD